MSFPIFLEYYSIIGVIANTFISVLFTENVSATKNQFETTNAIFGNRLNYSCHFLFRSQFFFLLVSDSRAVSVWRHFDKRWSCAQVNASTPTTTTIRAYGAHTVVSVEHRTANGEVESVYLCACCEPSTCIRLRSLTRTQSTRWSGVCVLTRLELFVLVYGWWGSLSTNREKIIRYGIGWRGSVTAFECIEQCSNWSETFRMSTTALPSDKWMIGKIYFAKMCRAIIPERMMSVWVMSMMAFHRCTVKILMDEKCECQRAQLLHTESNISVFQYRFKLRFEKWVRSVYPLRGSRTRRLKERKRLKEIR